MIDRLFLAQTYWKKGNSELDNIGLAVGGAALLIILAYAIIKNYKKKPSGEERSSGRASASGGGGGGGFNKGSFRKAARWAGLSETELRFLEDYARKLGLSNPAGTFASTQGIDAFFKKVHALIDRDSSSDTDADELKTLLFSARQRLTRGRNQGSAVASTRQLGCGMPLTFVAPGDESYPTAVVAVEGGGIAIEPVLDAYNEIIRFKRGSPLSCFFYTKGHKGYQFSSHIAGWKKIDDKEVMMIAHSDAVTALPTRSHARRVLHQACTFYKMQASAAASKEGEKGASPRVPLGGAKGSPMKVEVRARVESMALPGTAVDLSAGGIAIQSANALQQGDFIKVELDLGAGSQVAIGKVIRLNRMKSMGGVMHVQFVKIPRKTLNSILSFVYGYTD